MPIIFPSLDFFSALKKQSPEGSDSLEAVGDDDIMIGVEIGQSVFMMELADRACVAVAPGGNPIDMDFILKGAPENWLKLLSSVGDADAFGALIGQGRAIGVDSEVGGYDRFVELVPALRTLFAGAQSFDWTADQRFVTS
jgi:hypothetical protein